MKAVNEAESRVEIELSFFDEKGEFVRAGEQVNEIHSYEGFNTIGEAATNEFRNLDDKEFAEEVCYMLYITESLILAWRRRKGTNRSNKVWVTTQCEAVLFKMPKTKTLWQLLQRWRRDNRRVANRS